MGELTAGVSNLSIWFFIWGKKTEDLANEGFAAVLVLNFEGKDWTLGKLGFSAILISSFGRKDRRIRLGFCCFFASQILGDNW